MYLTTKHHRAAHVLWECGCRVDDAAARIGLRPSTLRRWLADAKFRSLVSRDAFEPLLQASSAMLRWTPAAVARLIEDLKSDSPVESRQAAREILKNAVATQREMTRPPRPRSGRSAGDLFPPRDALEANVAALSEDQLQRVLEILNEAGKTSAGKPAAEKSGEILRPPEGDLRMTKRDATHGKEASR
jgi:hypothetical protein